MKAKEKDSSVDSKFVKAFKAKQSWDKEDFLDVIYWMRQCLSIVLGVIWGVIPMQGFVGMLSFFAANIGIVYVYHTVYQAIDAEEYGGVWELVKEGMMGSFALFLVCWILTYSSLHF